MKELNNTLNNNETTAKITTEEALEIIAENYIKLDHFEQDYYRFIERVNKEVGNHPVRENLLLVDPYYFGSNIIGTVWEDLVFDYCDENDSTPALHVGAYWVHSLAYPESLFDDDEEFEFSVETLNGIADWQDGGLDNIIANTMCDLEEKLNDYLEHREKVVDTHRKLEDYMKDSMDEYNEILDVVESIDPTKVDDVSINLWGAVSEIFDIEVSKSSVCSFVYCRFDNCDDDIVEAYDYWVSERDDLYYQFDDAMNDVRMAFAKVCADNVVRSTLGFRENDVLDNLDKAEVVMNTTDHLVVRFTHIDGEHTFEYDFVTNKVVG